MHRKFFEKEKFALVNLIRYKKSTRTKLEIRGKDINNVVEKVLVCRVRLRLSC